MSVSEIKALLKTAQDTQNKYRTETDPDRDCHTVSIHLESVPGQNVGGREQAALCGIL